VQQKHLLMQPESFVSEYGQALAKQDWSSVEPLICKEASVTFSNGSVHIGIDKIKAAYQNNFSKIKNEEYLMKNITWLKKTSQYAVYIFEFSWSGTMNEKLVSGEGVGTTVIIKDKTDKWKLLSEHLGKK